MKGDQNDKKDRSPLNRKRENSIIPMIYGKVPPQARELEEAILGAIMLEKHAFDLVSEILKPECFYLEAHKVIFQAMQSLQQKSMPIDNLMVVEELRIVGQLEAVGGPFFVIKLTNNVVSAANIETHARIVLQKFIQRELIRISGEVIGDAYEDSADAFDLMDDAEKKLTGITSGHMTQNYVPVEKGLMEMIARIDQARHQANHLTGISSGFINLDKLTHGWQKSDLIILAARPSVGKTAFALNVARNCALDKINPMPVAFFSMEMSTSQLINRLASAESEIWLDKLQTANLDDNIMKILVTRIQKDLIASKIFIDDSAALNIYQLRSKCRQLKRKENIGLIIIDYLQLMSGVDDRNLKNREQEISNISRGLKRLAKELDLPIIALSQLSREPERRKGDSKMPVLSDLRESGAIEQDADLVMFMYRPEYYGQESNEMGESTRGETHLKIAKHRNGSLETLKFRAQLDIQKFEPWSELNFPSTLPGSKWRPVGEPKDDDLPM